MPPVKSRKKTARKPAAKKKKTSRARKLSPEEAFRNRLTVVWTGMLTYLAVGVTLVAVGTVLMLAVGGYFWNVGERIDVLTSRMAKSAGFSVHQVALRGASEVSDREIMMALRDPDKGSVLGQSLLNLNAGELRERIEALGWVRAASVQKLWPDTVHITIRERAPIATWQDKNNIFHLIDHEGEILRIVLDTDQDGFPVLTGTDTPAQAQDVLTALAARPELFVRVASVKSIEGRRYDIRFRNDFTAKLPETNVDVALDRLEGLGAGTGKLAEKLEYLDLRDPKWAYYRPKS